MDPQNQFCHNPDCPDRGRVGQGNIGVFSQKERRYECRTCGKTFAAASGTPFYRLRTGVDVVTLVLTLLCHPPQAGPIQAIVAAFGFDERTAVDWQARAGEHCERVHEHLVLQGRADLGHVQADELWVKMVGRRVWMAIRLRRMAVPARLWLGGGVSPHRDRALIQSLVESPAILVCVDGLASSVTAFLRVFRHPISTGKRGRPRLVVEQGLLIGQVVKQYARRRVVSVKQRVVRGTSEAISAVLASTGTGHGINTAYIERLNATFRSALVPLVRRGRALAHKTTVLQAGMFLVGCAYNFCWYHESLRQPALEGAGRKWQERTPAMAAGLTDHRWTMLELLSYQVPLPAGVAPKRRGRPPKQAQRPALAVAA